MKLTSVELAPDGIAEAMVMSFKDPTRQNPYNVKNIAGLDADELVRRSYRSDAYGPAFYELIMPKRNPVFRVELNPNFTISGSFSELRDNLYRFISSSRRGVIEVRFKNGENVIATLSGHVSKFEASLFTNQPEVQITLECKDSILRAPERTVVDISEMDPALTEIQDDASTAPHGLVFQMGILANRALVNIQDPSYPEWAFEVSPSGGFLTNDVLHFSSEQGNKHLYLVRGSNTIHLADRLTLGSIWPIIFPGLNRLSVSDPTTVEWLAIEHRLSYWGV